MVHAPAIALFLIGSKGDEMKKSAVSLVALLLMAGCATSVVSKETIIDNSSAAAGKKIVAIGEVKQVGFDSFYEATAQDGTIYTCSFNGGTAASMGIVQNQKCEVKK